MKMAIFGSGEYTYEDDLNWAKLPAGWSFREVVDVVVDAQDRVYVFNRGEHPLIVLERDGSFVTSWGEGLFTRPHALTIVPHEQYGQAVYTVDDEGNWIGHFTLDGELLSQIGERGKESPRMSGKPFNRPTKLARDPKSGALYISDGYGNARVHKYTPDGEHILSWGNSGVEPGQFYLPHSVCTDAEGKVYVADRENHRVQVFDSEGNYLSQWNNLFRPCGLYIAGDRAYIGQLCNQNALTADFPNLGACVTIHDLTGKQLARLGGTRAGEGEGEFTTPHGVVADSHGDLYVGEVSWSAYGRTLNPPRLVPCFRKLMRKR
jgi:DNA-binding beta-propeller fold protein YncE